MFTRWIAIFVALVLAFGVYSYVNPNRTASTKAQVGEETSQPVVGNNEKLRYLTTDWESLELATKEVKQGEHCYGDEVTFNNQNFNWKVVHFNSPTKVYVKWGACTTEPYSFEQIKVFLQARYPNREGNWEGVVEAP